MLCEKKLGEKYHPIHELHPLSLFFQKRLDLLAAPEPDDSSKPYLVSTLASFLCATLCLARSKRSGWNCRSNRRTLHRAGDSILRDTLCAYPRITVERFDGFKKQRLVLAARSNNQPLFPETIDRARSEPPPATSGRGRPNNKNLYAGRRRHFSKKVESQRL